MNKYTGQWIQAGLLMRRQIRVALIKAGFAFSEPSKGLFIIEESPAVYNDIIAQLQEQGIGVNQQG
jgi:hypothetical protein